MTSLAVVTLSMYIADIAFNVASSSHLVAGYELCFRRRMFVPCERYVTVATPGGSRCCNEVVGMTISGCTSKVGSVDAWTL